jgi:hypothetical protein
MVCAIPGWQTYKIVMLRALACAGVHDFEKLRIVPRAQLDDEGNGPSEGENNRLTLFGVRELWRIVVRRELGKRWPAYLSMWDPPTKKIIRTRESNTFATINANAAEITRYMLR